MIIFLGEPVCVRLNCPLARLPVYRCQYSPSVCQTRLDHSTAGTEKNVHLVIGCIDSTALVYLFCVVCLSLCDDVCPCISVVIHNVCHFMCVRLSAHRNWTRHMCLNHSCNHFCSVQTVCLHIAARLDPHITSQLTQTNLNLHEKMMYTHAHPQHFAAFVSISH